MKKRPISPHLQIYRWNIFMGMSIVHRFTSIATYFISAISAIIFCYCNQKTIGDNDEFANMINWIRNLSQCCLMKYVISAIIFGIILIITFNMLAASRYLLWSFAVGFNKKFVTISAYFIIFTSIILAALFSCLACKYLFIQ
jgi:succinate dehydrogenase / fumarate reductase, cytochrome b subunit